MVRTGTLKNWKVVCHECSGRYFRETANERQEKKVVEKEKCIFCRSDDVTVTFQAPCRPKLP